MNAPGTPDRQPRILVAIAAYGNKNLALLEKIIAGYHAMPMAVDVVILSNEPKELGERVRVLVGLPSEDPWSLPFAHKPLFAENADRYDLFIYSEDDIEFTQDHISAFLEVTPAFAPDELAGFLRYEVDATGARSMPDVHGNYHWKPETVARRGRFTVAEFSNEHSASYILTRAQLRQAIASGGFLRDSYEGRYDMLCAAATDPYTSCGFRKVICVSEVDRFLVHHMSNRYAGEMGVTLPEFRRQVGTLMAIAQGEHPATTLCHIESSLLRGRWSKDYYERPSQHLLDRVPSEAASILSIGCGWGATEAQLVKRGAAVTALPLDSVVGAEAERSGIEVVYASLEEGMEALQGRRFDCILIKDLLHLLPDPAGLLEQCSQLAAGGWMVIAGPNLETLRIRVSRALGRKGFDKLRSFQEGGIHVIGPSAIKRSLKRTGLNRISVRWSEPPEGLSHESPWGSLTAPEWVVVAQDTAPMGDAVRHPGHLPGDRRRAAAGE